MKEYTVDDRGNDAYFYEKSETGDWTPVARLDREAGPPGGIDSVFTWDGGPEVTEWAVENGYQEDIAFAGGGVVNFVTYTYE